MMISVEQLMQPVTSLQGAAAVFTFTQQRIYIDLQHIDCTDAAALNAGVYVPSRYVATDPDYSAFNYIFIYLKILFRVSRHEPRWGVGVLPRAAAFPPPLHSTLKSGF